MSEFRHASARVGAIAIALLLLSLWGYLREQSYAPRWEPVRGQVGYYQPAVQEILQESGLYLEPRR